MRGTWRFRPSGSEHDVRGAPRPVFRAERFNGFGRRGCPPAIPGTVSENACSERVRFVRRCRHLARAPRWQHREAPWCRTRLVPTLRRKDRSGEVSRAFSGSDVVRFRSAVCVVSVRAREVVSGCAGLRARGVLRSLGGGNTPLVLRGTAGCCNACMVSRLAARVRPDGGLRTWVFIDIV